LTPAQGAPSPTRGEGKRIKGLTATLSRKERGPQGIIASTPRDIYHENLMNLLEPLGRIGCLITPWHTGDLIAGSIRTVRGYVSQTGRRLSTGLA
jgi:hypothetical protein